jgi:5-methylcytosine-specific restriction endonuclease McrA
MAPRSRIVPIGKDRFEVRLSFGRDLHDMMRYSQELLGRQVPPGDLNALLRRAFAALIREGEKRKFAATDRPRHTRALPTPDSRHVPNAVKRIVWERDGGQCTFVGNTGHRCTARMALEYDHIKLECLGGRATVPNLRLRCFAHNQFEAERALGTEFMKRKRREAREAAEARKAAKARKLAEARKAAAAQAAEIEKSKTAIDEVIPYLRQMGLRPDDARRAASGCEAMADAPLEQRVRHAFACYGKTRFRSLRERS